MAELLDVRMLRALREARGWDQQTLAREAGVDPSVISRLERGLQDDFRVSVLVALARTLAIPVDSILAEPAVTPALDAELAAIVSQLGALTSAQQRQVAAILSAYLATLPV
jgi:transcriptional regulator with XRE-family HTH domain